MSIEQRLMRLERANGRWQIAAFTLTVLCAAVAGWRFNVTRNSALAAPPTENTKTLRVNKLEITDDSGRIVISLSGASLANGSAAGFMSFQSGDGKPTLLIISDGENGSLSIPHREGWNTGIDGRGITLSKVNATAAVEIRSKGLKRMTSQDMSQLTDPVVRIGGAVPGGGFIDVYNPLGNIVAGMQADRGNGGLVFVNDFNGDLRDAMRSR